MQLKLKRSQREAGVLSKNVVFCLDARVEFENDERQSINRYKLQNQVIYNSEAQLKLLEKSAAQAATGSIGGALKGMATLAFAHTKLHITINSLERGQHIECKSLDELLGAEEAILAACQNLKGYLDTALTFDGREVLVDFATGAAQVVAEAVAPQRMLVAAAPPGPPPPRLAAPANTQDVPDAAESTVEHEAPLLDEPPPSIRVYVDAFRAEPMLGVGGIIGIVFLLALLVRACTG